MIIAALEDDDRGVQTMAISALATSATPRRMPALLELARRAGPHTGASVEVRQEAIAALEAERRCRAEAAVADRFVGLLEEQLQVAEREAARLAVERTALGAEFARLWSARGERAGAGNDAR